MANTPLRDLPDEVLHFYGEQAHREGVSRNALLIRVLTDHARVAAAAPVTVADLRAAAARCEDLDDREVMADAWS
jgi:hypothetical protein